LDEANPGENTGATQQSVRQEKMRLGKSPENRQKTKL